MNSDLKQCIISKPGQVHSARALRSGPAHTMHCRAQAALAAARWACTPGRDTFNPLGLSRHAKGRPCPCLVSTPILGRDPKEARSCRDIKAMSWHQFLPIVS